MINSRQQLIAHIQQIKQHIIRKKEGENLPLIFNKSLAKSDQKNKEVADENWKKLSKQISTCSQCALSKTRRKVVIGEGSVQAKVVFIGEAPGAEEDKVGKPFVGAAGQLLTKIIASIGLKREQVYICNVLKCRPPGNRNPNPEEVKACGGYLQKQIELIKPKLICALGKFAAHTLLEMDEPIKDLRGREYAYKNIPVIPTFHPAALLYHPQNKRLVWEDMKKIAKIIKE